MHRQTDERRKVLTVRAFKSELFCYVVCLFFKILISLATMSTQRTREIMKSGDGRRERETVEQRRIVQDILIFIS